MQENLAKAIIKVMQEVKGIDKTMTVGSGAMSYKGVPDQEVKKIIGDAMAKNGLTMLPIDIEAKTEVSRWTETYQGQEKQKQSIFTEVKTKYLLLHESGESQVLSGYGHGVDSQDKGAGKATTYALKYALLYSFLVPTGKIDDADAHHSDNIETVKKNVAKKQLSNPEAMVLLKGCKTLDVLKSTFLSFTKDMQVEMESFKNEMKMKIETPLQYLNENSEDFGKMKQHIMNGGTMDEIETKYQVSPTVRELLLNP